MKISYVVLNGALNAQFRNGLRTYTLRIVGTGLGSTDNVVTFTDASNGVLSLSAPSYFAIPSGGVVTSVKLVDELTKEYLNADVTDRTYSANGTYTVSQLTVTLGV